MYHEEARLFMFTFQVKKLGYTNASQFLSTTIIYYKILSDSAVLVHFFPSINEYTDAI